jgi:uncharacterized membrane protein
MSLPSSEPLPENINELPPARQRHIRRRPRSASIAERQILVASMHQMTAPNIQFFVLSLVGSLILGAALFFDEPVILLAAVVTLPFLSPIFALALLPSTLKWINALKSILSLLILLLLTFVTGAVAGYLHKTLDFTALYIYRFSSPYWVDLAVVCVSTFFGALIFLRQGRLPRLVSVILAYQILVPLAVAGFAFPLGAAGLMPGALIVSLVHLLLTLLVATLALHILGFVPRGVVGWLVTLGLAAIALSALIGSLVLSGSLPAISATPTPLPVAQPTPVATELAAATTEIQTSTLPVPTFTITQANKPSATLTPAPTSTLTPTPEPTSIIAYVNSLNGGLLREAPSFDSLVVGYLNDTEEIKILRIYETEGARPWYFVETIRSETGWMDSSLAITQTPTATAE